MLTSVTFGICCSHPLAVLWDWSYAVLSRVGDGDLLLKVSLHTAPWGAFCHSFVFLPCPVISLQTNLWSHLLLKWVLHPFLRSIFMATAGCPGARLASCCFQTQRLNLFTSPASWQYEGDSSLMGRRWGKKTLTPQSNHPLGHQYLSIALSPHSGA